MPKCLLTCHPHTSGCTFGLDVCKTRGVKGAHFALGHINQLLKIIKYTGVFGAINTDTVDTKINTECEPTYHFDIFTSVTPGIYDLIIMPDCEGVFYTTQSELVFANTDGVFTNTSMITAFHDTVFTKILEALIPGGYLAYSKMVYLNTDTQKNNYVAVMNEWFDNYVMRWVYTDNMTWFVIHKLPNATGGKSKTRLKSRSKSKSKSKTKSKSRSKSKTKSKSKSNKRK